MKFSPARPYDEQRAALMAVISPKVRGWHRCHHCGKGCRDHTAMEFDHLGLRAWVVRRLNRYHRLRMMHREWLAAGGVVGLAIVGACIACNKSRGNERMRGNVYEGTPQAIQRAARGAGYTALDVPRAA